MTEPNAENPAAGAEQRGLKQALEQLTERVSELCAYTQYLGRVQMDTLAARARRTGMMLALGFFGALGFTALTFVLLFYCIHALARGFASWVDWPLWAGELLVGGVSLLGLLGAAACAYFVREHRRMQRKREDYDERNREQQARYERSVHSFATPAV
ncbi:MAG TPA: phage holin family protein [Phycisphaerae bacterium]|nr:phage holin family protein [Phycisphaerales bacterium]HRX86289.1 phage holin family protein [Phycisphaerae bacterium]